MRELDDDAKAKADDPIATIAPSLLLRTLSRLRVATVAELAVLDAHNFADLPAVGRVKVKQLVALHAHARAICGMVPEGQAPIARPPSLRERLAARDIDLGAPWHTVVRLAPARAAAALAEVSVTSLDELITALAGPRLLQVANCGRGTVRALQEQLECIAAHGLDHYLHGEALAIDSADALAASLERVLAAREWQILLQRSLGATLESIAEPLGVTRERVRQVEILAQREALRRFAEPLAKLVEALVMHLRERAVLSTIDEVAPAIRARDPLHVRLVLSLGAHCIALWRGRWLTLAEPAKLDAALRAARRALRGVYAVDVDTAWAAMKNSGLPLARHDVVAVAEAHLKMRLDETGRLVPRRRGLRHVLVEALDAAGGPLTLTELTARVQVLSARYALGPWKRRAVQAKVKGEPRIVTIGYSRYAHRRHAPVEARVLTRVVADVVEDLRTSPIPLDLRGVAATLRARVAGCAALDWRLLHGELAKHREVFVWRGSPLVGWRETTGAAWTSLRSAMVEYLAGAAHPVRAHEIASALERDVAVVAALIQQIPEALALGRGRYVHRDTVPFDEGTTRALVASAVALLPADGTPRGARRLARELLPLVDPAVAAILALPSGVGLLFGLVRAGRRQTTALRFGGGRLIARALDARERGPLVDTLILQRLREDPVATKTQLHRALVVTHGYDGASLTIRNRIDALLRGGAIGRFEGHWVVIGRPVGRDVSDAAG